MSFVCVCVCDVLTSDLLYTVVGKPLSLKEKANSPALLKNLAPFLLSW